MKRNLKKLTACILAATMVLGATVTGFAEDPTSATAPSEGGNASAEGKIEGVVNKDIFRVVLPTVQASHLQLILDPEDLLQSAGSTKYQGMTFTDDSDKLAYFLTADNTWTPNSATFEVINKSTGSVKVSVVATVTGLTDNTNTITMVDSATIATASTPSLFLTINGKTHTNKTDTTGTNGTVTAALNAGAGTVTITDEPLNALSGAYEVQYNGSDYVYELKSTYASSNDAFPRYSFSLSAQCNGTYNDGGTTKTVSWLAHKDLKPTLALAWTVKSDSTSAVKYVENQAPSIAQTDYPLTASTAQDVTVDFGKGTSAATKINKVTTVLRGTTYDMADYPEWMTISGNKITFSAAYVDVVINSGADRVHTVEFANADGAMTPTVDITLEVPVQGD